MPSDDIDREILLRIPNAGDMSDDELAQALLGIDWTSGEGGGEDPDPPSNPPSSFLASVFSNRGIYN